MQLSHAAFIESVQRGAVQVHLPAKPAAEFLSRRLLLPFFVMPVLGAGVGLALIGWIFTGLLVFGVGFAIPRLIKRRAPVILLNQALTDEDVYRDLLDARLLRLESR